MCIRDRLLQALLVDRFDAEEKVFDAEPAPEREHLLVAQQHVAAGLEIVFLLYSALGDGFPERLAVRGLDERDVVDDEDAGLLDSRELFHGHIDAHRAIGAAIEGPGAAEIAVPGAAARELDRGRG